MFTVHIHAHTHIADYKSRLTITHALFFKEYVLTISCVVLFKQWLKINKLSCYNIYIVTLAFTYVLSVTTIYLLLGI